MIERPETAVPSIAVSPLVFEIDQCARVDTTVVFNRLVIEIPIGTLTVAGTDLTDMGRTAHQTPLTICPIKDILHTYKKICLN